MVLRYAGVAYELREVLLRDKPAALLTASAKATVPVLCLPDGCVLEESREIMHWALTQNDPDGWLPENLQNHIGAWVHANDDEFKMHLDHYKYWERFPQQSQQLYRGQAEVFLQKLEQQLSYSRYLLAEHISLADVAIFPFIRQFAFVDKPWFDRAALPRLRDWLHGFLNAPLFQQVMQKYPPWQAGDKPVLISAAH